MKHRRTQPRQSLLDGFHEVRAKLAFGPKARAEFYALLQAFVADAVPLFDAVRDVHEGYVASGSAKRLITERILGGARGASGSVRRMSESMAWCASPAEVLALDAGEQAGTVALGLQTARDVALRNAQLLKSIVGRLLYPIGFLAGLVGLLIFVRSELIPLFTDLLPRAKWPRMPSILGTITDFVPVGLPVAIGCVCVYLVVFQVTASRWKPGPVRRQFDRYVFPYTVYAQANLAITLTGLSALVGAKVSFGSALERIRDTSTPWLRAQLDGVILSLRNGEREGDALARLYGGQERWLISAYGKRSNFAEALAGLSARINERLLGRIARRFFALSVLLLAFGAAVLAVLQLSFGEVALAIKATQ